MPSGVRNAVVGRSSPGVRVEDLQRAARCCPVAEPPVVVRRAERAVQRELVQAAVSETEQGTAAGRQPIGDERAVGEHVGKLPLEGAPIDEQARWHPDGVQGVSRGVVVREPELGDVEEPPGAVGGRCAVVRADPKSSALASSRRAQPLDSGAIGHHEGLPPGVRQRRGGDRHHQPLHGGCRGPGVGCRDRRRSAGRRRGRRRLVSAGSEPEGHTAGESAPQSQPVTKPSPYGREWLA